MHPLSQSSYKLMTGKEATPKERVLHYLGNWDYYVGAVKNFRFSRYDGSENKPTKPSAFLYNDLEIDLEILNHDELREHARNTDMNAPKKKINFLGVQILIFKKKPKTLPTTAYIHKVLKINDYILLKHVFL
ncbi:MAG: hypothetical protein IPK62_03170 [Bacteroidetes bacterium]|nr:hypothetical protein [Bacteroidota bacterium]